MVALTQWNIGIQRYAAAILSGMNLVDGLKKQIKVGDIVKKTGGHKDVGSIGVVLDIINNTDTNVIIISVLTDSVVVPWYEKYIEVLDES